ncbi:leucine-rich repeat, immunoglobulin-like domain and transmembrane domain-containing protein 3 precursor [Silurus asotus]|nr:leucine-rich repeat, immunoglobulin-like domain and transmembrane domain-containing protein 3 precursor [Silurus asotus]
MRCVLMFQVLLCCWKVAQPFCPSQCTCVFHKTRTVLCNDPDTPEIPVNIPLDTVKLRVEKTAVRRVKSEAFYYLTELRYLWLTYNSISLVDPSSFYNLNVLHELRLDGNQISIFPWEALREMPHLRMLDLHNNRLTSIPVEAAAYLVNVTYLDISSNKLNTLPSDLLDIWSPFSGTISTGSSSQKIILGLQDNIWYCDCRISKLIEMSKMADGPVVLMDPLVTCSGPENLAGVLFKRAELDQCVKPAVMTSATKITSSLGSNVLLRCDATGYPTPTLLWSRKDGSPLSNPVVQESPGEGVRWSILSLQQIVLKDAGVYRCRAKNVAGISEASITLLLAEKDFTTSSFFDKTLPAVTEAVISFSSTTTNSTPTTSTSTSKPSPATLQSIANRLNLIPGGGIQRSSPTGNTAKMKQRKIAPKDKFMKKSSLYIRDIEVVEETEDSAVVLWITEGFPNEFPLSVEYFPYDAEEIKETVDTEVGNGKLLLENLFPNQVYTVCLVPKSGEEQCRNFSTLDNVIDDTPNGWLLIITGLACVFVLPLIALLLYKISSLYCKRSSKNPEMDEDLSKETYVKFETLAMQQRTLNGQASDLWTRRLTQESERMLLCSRSSMDSQMTYKSDNSRSEFLC